MQSRGTRTRTVDWCQSAALLVRRAAAEEVDYLDGDFFVYSDEVDFARRLRNAGWRSLYVPAAVALHHEQLSTGALGERRIVEMARNRDLYMRKHHSHAAAAAVRWLTAWAYALRALAALLLPGHSPRRYWQHVLATLKPARGQGLREAAEEHNSQPAKTVPAAEPGGGAGQHASGAPASMDRGAARAPPANSGRAARPARPRARPRVRDPAGAEAARVRAPPPRASAPGRARAPQRNG